MSGAVDTRAVVAPAGTGWSAAAATRTGSRRPGNEDDWTVVPDGPALLLAVADGVGGEAAGEEASAAAVAALASSWRAAGAVGGDVRALTGSLRRAAAAADNAVQALAAGRPEARGAATTLTAVAVAGDAVVVAHAGDSRAYLVGGAGAVQLTVDHTLVQEHPEMAPDEAGALRHVITRFLGQPGGCPFDVSTHALPPGAGLLLCTDGVTNVVPPQRLAGVVRPGEGEGVAGGAERVVALVEALDGADDATIVVAWPAATIGAAGVLDAAAGTAGDPFRLRRLLERERPGRRGRLTRGALLALLGAAGVGAAWYRVGPRLEEAVRRPFLPPPDAAAREYLQAWSAGDLGTLYRRLTPEAQRAYSEEAFTALHRQAGAEMTLQSLQLTIRPGEASGSGGPDGVPFEAAYITSRFGALRRENGLPLAWREEGWRVAWTPAVLLPDLAGG
ncbi:MAG TPA: protein phosphatase 2C domain-containing protein, partial [Chloroflexota bacterium]|nr:protein phosphatase 2C domain-containing protein [Chloroflexota bacterium]